MWYACLCVILLASAIGYVYDVLILEAILEARGHEWWAKAEKYISLASMHAR